MLGEAFIGGPFDVALTKVLGHPSCDDGLYFLHKYGPSRRDWVNFSQVLRDVLGRCATDEEMVALQQASVDEVTWWKAKKAAERHPCPTCKGSGWVG
jgi:hypothetical protein